MRQTSSLHHGITFAYVCQRMKSKEWSPNRTAKTSQPPSSGLTDSLAMTPEPISSGQNEPKKSDRGLMLMDYLRIVRTCTYNQFRQSFLSEYMILATWRALSALRHLVGAG